MPANSDPMLSRLGDVSNNGTTAFGAAMVTATADYTGQSANHVLCFTADATNGGFVQKLRLIAIGTNVATVVRIYINNGSTNATAANNVIYEQQSLPATTASNTVATINIDIPLNIALNPGFRIYAGVATTVASGWVPVAVGGKY